MLVRLTAAATITALSTAAHAQFCFLQELVNNGGFETPTVPANTYQVATPTGWGWLGTPAFLIHTGYGGIWPTAWQGNQYLDLGNGPAYQLFQHISVPHAGDVIAQWNYTAANTAASAMRVNIDEESLTWPTIQFDTPVVFGNAWRTGTGEGAFFPRAGTFRVKLTALGPADVLVDGFSIAVRRDPHSYFKNDLNINAVPNREINLNSIIGGEPPIATQWEFWTGTAWSPLPASGPIPGWGTVLSSVSSFGLDLLPTVPGATAFFRQRLTNFCSTNFTPLYVVSTTPCDSLDFNGDGNIDPSDVDAYFSVLGEGPCVGVGPFGCGDLDYNNDGNIDPADVDAYFSVLGEGPCL